MTWGLEPIRLENDRIVIRPLEEKDFTTIAEALLDPQGFFAKAWGIKTVEDIQKMLHSNLEGRRRGRSNPFVYFVGDEVAGISRFLNIDPTHRCLEIGGTWVAPRWRRSFVNTNVKYLLLRYLFEQLDAARVEFRVNALNFRSQMAVLRLGAVFEAQLRQRTLPPLMAPQSMFCYSVIKPEWHDIKTRLENLQSGIQVAGSLLPFRFSTERLQLILLRLGDAQDFFELAHRNQEMIRASFPKAGNFQTSGEAEAFIADKVHGSYAGKQFFYGIRLNESDKLLGHLHIKDVNWDTLSADIGYFIDYSQWRKGYASEVVSAALNVLKGRGFEKATLRTLDDNFPSQGLAEKLGFTKEGYQRQSFRDGHGNLRDTYSYAKRIV
jgi:RimJ/RimL family protein N-acetyltransferase